MDTVGHPRGSLGTRVQAESREESEEVAKLKVALMKIQGGLESANDARDSV